MTDPERLCACGCKRPARVGGTLSSTCYMRQYRQTDAGKKASRTAHRRWRKNNPEKVKFYDTTYKKEWRARTHFYVPPEVHELRQAVKRLEAALAAAEQHPGVRRPGQPAGDDGA